MVYGNIGADLMYGAPGRNTLDGGSGNDFLRGGTLGDTFIFYIGHDQYTLSSVDWLDQIHILTKLTDGLRDAAEIVETFGVEIDGWLALSFVDGGQIEFRLFLYRARGHTAHRIIWKSG